MRISSWGSSVLAVLLVTAAVASADTIITREGASYSGRFLGAKDATIAFTDTSGIGYTFPVSDVQSLVLSRPTTP